MPTKNCGVKMKCDIIIPIYKAPEWVKLCVYALFTNTNPKIINKVYLINDCDDDFTTNCLKNLKAKYGNKIVLKQNGQNLGFIKTVNKGLNLSSADYILLLNSDCLIAKNCIEKLINHLEKDSKIGLICPLASNAANITLPMPEGWNYTQIDSILEKYFLGQNFDACTIVGNCLMITRNCLNKVGNLDEAYGTGYGEETDYQFKAMEKGFKAKVAIDTYVFHKAEASFGTSKEKQAKLQKNRNLFFSRWGKIYEQELKKYKQNDPIEYINNHLPKDIWRPKIETLFYVDGIVQNAGGIHVVIDIVNYLTINGTAINIIYNLKYPYQENMLFAPIPANKIKDVEVKQIVSTIWKTAFEARTIANQKNAKLLSFIQGYELYFENGSKYGAVELSYKISNGLLTISKYLQKELKTIFEEKSEIISNGINLDLIYNNSSKNNSIPTITIIMRDNPMKGDWILIDIIKRLSNLKQKVKINLVSVDKKIILPSINEGNKITIFNGPQNRNTIYKLLQNSDLYIDASLSEGFGLTALEAMAAGCIPIVSDSMGINEYIENEKNGIIIKDVNNANSYITQIERILKDPKKANLLKTNGKSTATSYDFDKIIEQYIKYFENPLLKKIPEQFSDKEKAIIDSMQQDHNRHARHIRIFKIAEKITPKPTKMLFTKIINKLYNYLNK